MKAGSAELIELARQAGVRCTVVWHAYSLRKEMKGKATPEGYAAFTELPIEAAQRVFAVLDGLPIIERKPRQRKLAHALPEGFAVPDDWLADARSARFWPMDVCRTEAVQFVNWHRMKGTIYADWRAAWRHWFSKDWKQDGKPLPADSPDFSDPEVQRKYLERWR